MPTNKLWIEHTERAAWDSVEALRERLLKAESRLQALASGVDRVPQLLDALDAAKQKYAPGAQTHDEVVTQLTARIESLQTELTTATSQPQIVSFASVVSLEPARPRLDSDELELLDRTTEQEDELDLAGFTKKMQRHGDAARAEPSRDLERLLTLAENKLDDLTELEGGALREAALDLAILAGRIHGASRRRS